VEHWLTLITDAAAASALLVLATVGGYLAIRLARRRFPTAAERRLLDQQDAILDTLASFDERLQSLESKALPGRVVSDEGASGSPDRTPTPV